MTAPPNLLKTNGRCRACDGVVTNIDRMAGRSLSALADRHAESCPSLRRGAKLALERADTTTVDHETVVSYEADR